MGDVVTAGDDECSGEVVHAGVGHGVAVEAGGDPEGAGEVGFPASGGGGDEHVECFPGPVAGRVALHSDFRDAAAFAVVDFIDGGAGDREAGFFDQPADPVGASGIKGVSGGGEEQLFGGQVVVGFISNEFFKPCCEVGDA